MSTQYTSTSPRIAPSRASNPPSLRSSSQKQRRRRNQLKRSESRRAMPPVPLETTSVHPPLPPSVTTPHGLPHLAALIIQDGIVLWRSSSFAFWLTTSSGSEKIALGPSPTPGSILHRHSLDARVHPWPVHGSTAGDPASPRNRPPSRAPVSTCLLRLMNMATRCNPIPAAQDVPSGAVAR